MKSISKYLLLALLVSIVICIPVSAANDFFTNPGFEWGNSSGWDVLYGDYNAFKVTDEYAVHTGTYSGYFAYDVYPELSQTLNLTLSKNISFWAKGYPYSWMYISIGNYKTPRIQLVEDWVQYTIDDTYLYGDNVTITITGSGMDFSVDDFDAPLGGNEPFANWTPVSGMNSSYYVLVPRYVQFNDTSAHNPTSWNWSFGDGTYSDLQNPTHWFNTSGNYTVKLTATNEYGSDTRTRFFLANTSLQHEFGSISNHFISADGGDRWDRESLSARAMYPRAQSIMYIGNHTIIASIGEYDYSNSSFFRTISRSTDDGNSWQIVFNYTPVGDYTDQVYNFANLGDGTVIGMSGTKGDIYRSTDYGATWGSSPVSSIARGENTYAPSQLLYIGDGKVIAACSNLSNSTSEIYTSTNYGINYTLTSVIAGEYQPVENLLYLGNNTLLASVSTDQLMKSTDLGSTWYVANVTQSQILQMSNYGNGTALYTNYYELPQVHRSTDYGENWVVANGSFEGWSSPTSLIYLGNTSGLIIESSFTHKTTDNGYTWTKVLDFDGSYIITEGTINISANVTSSAIPFAVKFTDTSTNAPTLWNWSFGDGYYSNERNPAHAYTNVGIYNATLTTYSVNGVYNKTIQITASAGGLTDFTSNVTTGSSPFAVQFNDTSGGTPNGWSWLFGDTNYTQIPWKNITGSPGWTRREGHATVTLPNGTLVMLSGYDYTWTQKNDVWISPDEGITWTQACSSAGWSARDGTNAVSLSDGTILLFAGYDGANYKNDTWKSTNNGTTWTLVNASSGWTPRYRPTSVVLSDDSIIMLGGEYTSGSNLNDVWMSTDKGATWTQRTSSAGWAGRQMFATVVLPDSSLLVFGGSTGGGTTRFNDTWRSIDKGATWVQVNSSAAWSARDGHTGVAFPNGDVLLLGGGTTLNFNDTWVSRDKGATWQVANLTSGWKGRGVFTANLLPDGNIIIVGGWTSGMVNDVWRANFTDSTTQNPKHTYNDNIGHAVALTAKNTTGYNTSLKYNYINSALPVTSFIINGTLLESPRATTFADISTNNPTSWSWSYRNVTGNNTPIIFSTLQNPEYTFGIGNWSINLTATNNIGSNTTSRFMNITRPATLSDALDNPPVSVTTNGTGQFVIDYVTYIRGGSSAFAGITTSQTAWLNITVSGNKNTTIWTKYDTEEEYDYFYLYIDDVQQFEVSGSQDWTELKYNTSGAGDHRLSFAYITDDSWEENGVYIDNLTTGSTDIMSLFTSNVTIGSAPTAVQFTDASTGSPTSWNWSFNNVTGNNTDIWFSTEQNPVYVFGLGNWSIRLNATSAVSTDISAPGFVNVSKAAEIPIANFTTNTTSGGAPLAVRFNDTSSDIPTSWNWTFSNVTGNDTTVSFATTQNPAYVFGVGNWSIKLTTANTAGSNTTPGTYFINTTAPFPPIVSFNYTYTGNYIAPATVIFNDTSQNLPTTWCWTFQNVTGNNTLVKFSNSKNVSYTFGTGNWSILLNVSNGAGYNITQTPLFFNITSACAPTVTLDGSYDVVTFNSAETCSWIAPSDADNVTVLMVGGGGSGGFGNYGFAWQAGGGGAGGLLTGDINLTPGQIYPVTVGAGGGLAGGTGYLGQNGTDTLFAGYIAYGGGGGSAGQLNISGKPGGSGGGGYTDGNAGVFTQNNQSPLRGYGNTGSKSSNGGNGGGAAGVPTGLLSCITGTAVTYAQGGSASATCTDLTTNGYGSNGAYNPVFRNYEWQYLGCYAGSGVIIIRYQNTTPTAPIANFTSNVSAGYGLTPIQFNDTSSVYPANATAWNWSFKNVTGNNTEVWFSQAQNPSYTFDIGNWLISLNASNNVGYNITSKFINVSARYNDTWYPEGTCYKLTNSSYTAIKCNSTTGIHNWTAPTNVTYIEYLIVAGGGGGGTTNGAGGGAGGLLFDNSNNITAGVTYQIVVGKGGLGGNFSGGDRYRGSNGTYSSFNTISATGGGGGGSFISQDDNTGRAGGSGGGSGFPHSAGAGISGQGNNGGLSSYGGAGSGGGGKNESGVGSGSSDGGKGGNGTTINFIVFSGNYSGGGGGGGINSGLIGLGGFGGGGNGGNTSTTQTAGTAETGGGGGGGKTASGPGVGADGGSGVVIFRYNESTVSLPTASFTTNVTTGTMLVAVQFNDTTTGVPSPIAWNWSFRDVTGNNTEVWFSSGSTQNPVRTFGLGNWSIRLNATNTIGQDISTQTTFINVSPLSVPIVNFTSDIVSGTAATKILFNDSSKNATSWSWTFQNVTGNNTQVTFSTQRNPVYTFGIGNWSIVLTASNVLGSNATTSSYFINISSPLIVGFTANNTNGYIPLPVQFNDTTVGTTPTNWMWYFGDENWTNNSWSQVTASANWSGRYNHFSVVLPDGSIVTVGGYENTGGGYKNDVWRSTDQGTTWTQQTASPGWGARTGQAGLALSDGSILALGGFHDGPIYYQDVWRSTNKGVTWTQLNASTCLTFARGSLAEISNNSILFVSSNDVWRSDDKGTTWTQVNASLNFAPNHYPSTITRMPDKSIVAISGQTYSELKWRNSVWRSTDEGVTWTEMYAVSTWAIKDAPLFQALPDGSILLLGGDIEGSDPLTGYNDVWRSTDNGATWVQLPNAGWSARAYSSSVLLQDGTVEVMGGIVTNINGNAFHDVWRYNTSSTFIQNPVHNYTSSGSFNVTLQTYNGDTVNQTKKNGYITVTYNAPPVASFTTNTTTGVDPTGVQFTDTSTLVPNAWNWSFRNVTGNNTEVFFSTAQNPTYAFGVGSWSIKLRATNPLGENTSTQTTFINVSVASAPISSFSTNATGGMSPVSIQFTDTSVNPPDTWNWSFTNISGNNTEVWFSSGSTQNPKYTFGIGNWKIRLMASNYVGQNISTQTTFINVTLYPTAPIVNFTSNITTGVEPTSAQFTDDSTGSPTGWTWWFGNENWTNKTWTQKTSCTTWSSYPSISDVTTVSLSDNSIVSVVGYNDYSGHNTRVYRSTNEGTSWSTLATDVPWDGVVGRSGEAIVALPDGSIELLGGEDQQTHTYQNDVWRSTDYGATWTQLNVTTPYAQPIYSSTVTRDGYIVIFGSTGSDVWISSDKGYTWTEMTASASWGSRSAEAVVTLPNNHIVLMGGYKSSSYKRDVWRSTDNGSSWTEMTSSAGWSQRTAPTAVALPDGSIVLMGGQGTSPVYKNDVWRSTDEGATWTEMIASSGWSGTYGSKSVILPNGDIVLIYSSSGNEVWSLTTAGSTTQNPSRTYAAGNYSVTLKAYTSTNGNQSTRSGYINITAVPPVASFSANSTTGIYSGTIQFTDTSSGTPTTWDWKFTNTSGNNTPTTFATTQNPAYTFGGGNYSISLTVSNSAGSNNSVSALFVNVSSTCIPMSMYYTNTSTVVIFNRTGTCTWQIPTGWDNINYLVVAGGGGGGRSTSLPQGASGGGGAGGVLSGNTNVSAGQQIQVTVGSGGSGYKSTVISNGTSCNALEYWAINGTDMCDFGQGYDGSNSSLLTGTATVETMGGGGGGAPNGGNISMRIGRDGGSGGGGSYNSIRGGYGIPGQGHDGESGAPYTNNGGSAGIGRNGTVSNITGIDVSFGGGGGGGLTYGSVDGTGGKGTTGLTDFGYVDPMYPYCGMDGYGANYSCSYTTSPPTQGADMFGGGGGGDFGGRSANLIYWNFLHYDGADGGDGVVIISYPTPPPPPLTINVTSMMVASTHTVRFHCVDYLGAPISNMSVSVVGVETTLGSLDWVPYLFGINLNNTPILNTTMTATTGDDGSAVFVMMETEKYALHYTSTEKGIDETRYYYPKESEYTEIFWTESPVFIPPTIPVCGDRAYNYSATPNGTSMVDLHIGYYDCSGTTSNMTFYVTDVSDNKVKSVLYSNLTVNPNNFIVSYPVQATQGAAYRYGITGRSNTNAPIYQENTFALNASQWKANFIKATDGDPLAVWFYNSLAIALISLVGYIFSRASIKFAVVVVPLFGLLFKWMGWLETTWLLVSTAMILGVLFYLRFAEEESQL
jgi:PKD repeat protein